MVLPRLCAGVAALALAVVSLAPRGASAAPAEAPHFVVAPLPNPAGVTTPRNEDVEPGIGIDGAGTIWIGSNIDGNTGNDPRSVPGVGVLSGEDLWRSVDGGRSFQWVGDPYGLNGPDSFGLGGEDSDATAAPEKNSQGFYNVYGVSLYLAASTLAYSQDGGRSFQLIQLGGVPAQDRPWVSADGPCTVYLTYHQLPLFLPVVNTYDVCTGSTFGVPALTINPLTQTSIFADNSAPGLTNAFNKPMVDTWPASPHRHNIYVPMEACDMNSPQDFLNTVVTTAEQIPVCGQGVDTMVEVAVSTDQGASFTTHVVAVNDNGEQQVWPTSAAVGPDGSVVLAWGDNHHAYTSVSRDGGTTWSARQRVDAPPVGTADYPTVAAGPDGRIDVAYYGATVHGDTNDANGMGKAGDPGATAQWRLYLSRSRDGGRSFQQHQVSGLVHTGVLCTEGTACSGKYARDLYDDFGVAVSRVSGLTTIAFDSDEAPGSPPSATPVDPFTSFATELPAAAPLATPAATPAPTPAARPIGTPNTAAPDPRRLDGLAAALLLAILAAGSRRRARAPRG
jgi:hypothetical protein